MAVIRSVFEPTIQLDEVSFSPIGYDDPKTKRNEVSLDDVGTGFPLVLINDFLFKQTEILEFCIDCTGFIPKLFLKVNPVSSFSNLSIPKDGDLVSIFIRAKNKIFKPIRNDYLITSVSSTQSFLEGEGSIYIIEGVLFVPRIFDEIIYSVEGTSYSVLQEICRSLGLGFSTNDDSGTKDYQKWICPSDSRFNFMQKISEHIWKDEKSFFKCFIDVYYHFNFVNVQKVFEGEEKLTLGLIDTTFIQELTYENSEQMEKSQTVTKKILTDMRTANNTNFFVESYAVQNNSSEIARRYGYKTYVSFFDERTAQFWDIFVEPLITTESETKKLLLKGRPKKKRNLAGEELPESEDFWKTQNRRFWRGIQSRNVHEHFYFSEIWNKRNNEELNKLYIEASVLRWNPNIFRGDKIPVLLLITRDPQRLKKNLTSNEEVKLQEENSDGLPAIDKFYSGFYFVDGFKIYFKHSDKQTVNLDLRQIFRLTKREWNIPQVGWNG